jgi:hypothetical protein
MSLLPRTTLHSDSEHLPLYDAVGSQILPPYDAVGVNLAAGSQVQKLWNTP